MNKALEFDAVFMVNGRMAIKLQTFAKLLHYSDVYLLQLVKKIAKKGVKVGFKWRRNWYIFLPRTPINKLINNKNNSNNNNSNSSDGSNGATMPSGNTINDDWEDAINEFPSGITDSLARTSFTISTINNQLVIATGFIDLLSSAVDPKKVTLQFPLSQQDFKATTDYKYGYYIYYREDRMSTFDPGDAGTLKSTQLPAALFEICRALDAAENTRNGANPGLTPRRNISTTVSFDTGTIAVAATIPVTPSIGAGGLIQLTASDYLGAPYSNFTNGGGDLASDTLPEALLEMANLLAAAEKAVTPAENQPNNVQVQFDLETGSATISANMPFTTAAATNGDVTVHAIDYL
ncbi:hypothetical protein H6G80_03155 [Nostoc sp. FACHB-87]|uniref:hypothetical protein n=1 Tax=Nostocaceae TaxID=1162 RepID=UPI001682B283|nr:MULTISPECIES: hypothetical protein [Nostocaceae]MBD2416064.1 hypothetical protein [Nostoc calcicola FACHB-3891]MBD2453072.1 hypothetical protein [Nostoc sp. FACHB-87]MBD2475150.1 hypothetical protein [Anabaena sp. FACHB-83]